MILLESVPEQCFNAPNGGAVGTPGSAATGFTAGSAFGARWSLVPRPAKLYQGDEHPTSQLAKSTLQVVL